MQKQSSAKILLKSARLQKIAGLLQTGDHKNKNNLWSPLFQKIVKLYISLLKYTIQCTFFEWIMQRYSYRVLPSL